MQQGGRGPWDRPRPARDPYLGQVLPEHLLKDIPEPSLWSLGHPWRIPRLRCPWGGRVLMALPSSPAPPSLGSLWELNSSDTLEMLRARCQGDWQGPSKREASPRLSRERPKQCHS